VHTASIRFELHVPESRSLKAKRAAIRPIVDGLRSRFKASVAEVDHQDLWQRAAIGVAVVGAHAGDVEKVLGDIDRFVASAADVEVIDTEWCWLDPDRSELTEWSS
jgi:uncharacterized protein YlxP (DUF503 family)